MSPIKKIALLLVSAMAAIVGAQDTSQFPECAKFCITQMKDVKANELGCNNADYVCLCRNPNFTYGVRDCSGQHCASPDAATKGAAYAEEFCRNNGVNLATVTTGEGAAPTASGTASGGGSGGSAISTAAIVTTITTDGSTIVSTLGSSTIFATGSGSAGSGSSATTVTSVEPILSTSVSGSSTAVVTVGSSTFTTVSTGAAGGTTGGSGSGTGNGGSNPTSSSSSSSSGFAPQMTAAPVGFLAAAGVAALLL